MSWYAKNISIFLSIHNPATSTLNIIHVQGDTMRIQDKITKIERPVKVVQFGEGRFLRGFADYMIDVANEQGVFNGNIVMIKPRPFGSVEKFTEQDSLYTVILRGKENREIVNKSRIISSISQTLNCGDDYPLFMQLAHLDSIRFFISNTTEKGIELDLHDHFERLPETYPGKLTKFLYERFMAFGGDKDKGLIIIPTELIEHNGKILKDYVLQMADVWGLSSEFKMWVREDNIFCSTLVDRIVTGFPDDYDDVIKDLGYEDKLITIGEPFALWVIESEKDIRNEFPLNTIGLPVIFTNDATPYWERKVRVLNGAHTSSVLIGYLCGFDIVRECMQDELMGEFIHRIVIDEIVPQVHLPLDEVVDFANSVFERFENPFIDHSLLTISLSSILKWKVRLLPSFREYYEKNRYIPKLLTFSFAVMLAFYSSNDFDSENLYNKRANNDRYKLNDSLNVLKFFADNSTKDDFVERVCSNVVFWDEDLTQYDNFVNDVTEWYIKIKNDANKALIEVLGKKEVK